MLENLETLVLRDEAAALLRQGTSRWALDVAVGAVCHQTRRQPERTFVVRKSCRTAPNLIFRPSIMLTPKRKRSRHVRTLRTWPWRVRGQPGVKGARAGACHGAAQCCRASQLLPSVSGQFQSYHLNLTAQLHHPFFCYSKKDQARAQRKVHVLSGYQHTSNVRPYGAGVWTSAAHAAVSSRKCARDITPTNSSKITTAMRGSTTRQVLELSFESWLPTGPVLRLAPQLSSPYQNVSGTACTRLEGALAIDKDSALRFSLFYAPLMPDPSIPLK